jgi:hypothetical protein
VSGKKEALIARILGLEEEQLNAPKRQRNKKKSAGSSEVSKEVS